MKKYLFVMRHGPHDGGHLQETLDLVLTTAAFDQYVALLFLDYGVFQLNKNQNPSVLNLKDTLAAYQALALYDVNDLYVEWESLAASGLESNDLILPFQGVHRRDIGKLMQLHHVVIPD